MKLPCTVLRVARLAVPPGWDWSQKITPPVEDALEWPRAADPPPDLVARVQRLADWTRAFTAKHRGIDLHAITIRPGDHSPRLEVLIVRDDIDGAEDETAAARSAAQALAQEHPDLAAGVTFRGEYCK